MCGSRACSPWSGPAAWNPAPSALAKIRAGATLLQLYSGLVFRGLGLIDEIKAALVDALESDRLPSLTDYVGVDAASVTAEPWPQ